jgi:hypothetical protein
MQVSSNALPDRAPVDLKPFLKGGSILVACSPLPLAIIWVGLRFTHSLGMAGAFITALAVGASLLILLIALALFLLCGLTYTRRLIKQRLRR